MSSKIALRGMKLRIYKIIIRPIVIFGTEVWQEVVGNVREKVLKKNIQGEKSESWVGKEHKSRIEEII